MQLRRYIRYHDRICTALPTHTRRPRLRYSACSQTRRHRLRRGALHHLREGRARRWQEEAALFGEYWSQERRERREGRAGVRDSGLASSPGCTSINLTHNSKADNGHAPTTRSSRAHSANASSRPSVRQLRTLLAPPLNTKHRPQQSLFFLQRRALSHSASGHHTTGHGQEDSLCARTTTTLLAALVTSISCTTSYPALSSQDAKERSDPQSTTVSCQRCPVRFGRPFTAFTGAPHH